MNDLLESIRLMASLPAPLGMTDGRRAQLAALLQGSDIPCETTEDGALLVRGSNVNTVFVVCMGSPFMRVESVDERGFVRLRGDLSVPLHSLEGKRLRFTGGALGCVSFHTSVDLWSMQDYSSLSSASFAADIGARDRAEALKLLTVGECAVLESGPYELANGCVGGANMGGLGACALMLRLIETMRDKSVAFVFAPERNTLPGCVGTLAPRRVLYLDCVGSAVTEAPRFETQACGDYSAEREANELAAVLARRYGHERRLLNSANCSALRLLLPVSGLNTAAETISIPALENAALTLSMPTVMPSD